MSLVLNGTTGIVSANIQDGTIVGSDIATGTITADKLDPSALVITYPMLSNSATEANNVAKRTAKAWVMFNGTGTPAIANDFNVSSITDGGVGLFTVNLTTVASVNDCVVCNASDRNPATNMVDFSEAYMTAGGNVFFSCFDQSAFKDPLNAHVLVFGN